MSALFPWTRSPLIINAPMGGFAGGLLASAVSLSGGLGQIGAINLADNLQSELGIARAQLSEHGAWKEGEMLPIGVGLLPFISKMDDFVPVLAEYRPAAIWLFATTTVSEYAELAARLRAAVPGTKILVQTGSVAAALEIARDTKPDAIVLQGSDAGGHGYEKGCGIISLVPEALTALATAGFDLPVFAAGGIAEERGAAAAFVLGASGVVMGTRFLAARETSVPDGYRDRVLKASDGGQSTVRSKLFDEVRGPNIWPSEYDGRSLVTASFTDWTQGMAIDQVRKKHNEAEKNGKGFEQDRANVWVGSAVGLVTKLDDAADIVEQVRSGVRNVLKTAATAL